jgi:transcriptional regulator with XRE-family HTH domain
MTTSVTAVLQRFRTPLELGALIRGLRTDRGWTQAELARRAEVGRQWLVAVERGQRAGAELALVLRVLNVLGAELFARTAQRPVNVDIPAASATASATPPAIDLDALIDEFTSRTHQDG